MAIEGELAGLFVGADARVIYRNYEANGITPKDMAGWNIILDFRISDLATATLKAVGGVVSGTFNVDPLTNTQICTFTLTDDDLAASIFTGDDTTFRYSIKRVNDGVEAILRFGDAVITRATQV